MPIIIFIFIFNRVCESGKDTERLRERGGESQGGSHINYSLMACGEISCDVWREIFALDPPRNALNILCQRQADEVYAAWPRKPANGQQIIVNVNCMIECSWKAAAAAVAAVDAVAVVVAAVAVAAATQSLRCTAGCAFFISPRRARWALPYFRQLWQSLSRDLSSTHMCTRLTSAVDVLVWFSNAFESHFESFFWLVASVIIVAY